MVTTDAQDDGQQPYQITAERLQNVFQRLPLTPRQGVGYRGERGVDQVLTGAPSMRNFHFSPVPSGVCNIDSLIC